MRAFLSATLDYDLWAWTAWEGALAECPFAERGRQVLGHHVEAASILRERVCGCLSLTVPSTQEAPQPGGGGAQALEVLAAWWKEAAEALDLDADLEWMPGGRRLKCRVQDVLTQISLHGAYHRGQLRGLAEAAGWRDFPETDLAIWAKGRPLEGSPELAAHLARRHEHDRWAWALLEESPEWRQLGARAEAVRRHHAGCPEGWGGGVAGALRRAGPEEGAGLEAASAWWRQLLSEADPGAPYTWKRTKNPHITWAVGWVSAHTTHHGAYHRGHIRGLFEAAGIGGHPETDFLLFADEAGKAD